MAIPIRSKNPPESFPFATIFLIVANVLVYIVTTKNGLNTKPEVIQEWGLKASSFTPTTILSSMFVHANIVHLLGNMWFLSLFGISVEGRLRWYRFLPLYLLSGLAGVALHVYFLGKATPDLPLVGASGAIMGVMGAALWMFPHAKITVFWWTRYRVGMDDFPMWGVGLYFIGLDLLYFMIFGQKSGTAHLAHLGGTFAGFILCILCFPKRDSEMASDSKAVLAEVKDLGVLGRIELAELHRTNPEDVHVVLHWMDKSLREPRGPNQECVDAFFKHLPKMRREMDPRTLAKPIQGLAFHGLVKAKEMVALAGDLERAADNVNAMRLYETAYGMPDATDEVQETACFRTGLLCENVMNDLERAKSCYTEVLQRWPMGSFADQAKVRLTGIQNRTKVAP